jgi:hypothetical protein
MDYSSSEIILTIAILVVAISTVNRILKQQRSSESTDKNRPSNESLQPDHTQNDKDAWEGGFYETANPRPVSATLKFEYRDANDSVTNRTVEIRGFDAGSPRGLMIGRCLLRKATRTFRQDRVTNCVDVTTGEVVTDLWKHLKEIYERSDTALLDCLESDRATELDVVVFLARADGAVRKAERQLISEYCRQYISNHQSLSDEEIMDRVLSAQTLSITQFRRAVTRLSETLSEVERNSLISLCESLVATQKSIHPAEQDALLYLWKRLRPQI